MVFFIAVLWMSTLCNEVHMTLRKKLEAAGVVGMKLWA